MNAANPKPITPAILSEEEQNERREELRKSYHESLIEGGCIPPDTQCTRDAYIRSEIDNAEAIVMVNNHYRALAAKQ